MSKLKRLRRWMASTPLRHPLVWHRHRGLEANDVMVAAYPRSGSTWLRFLLYELLTGEPAGFAAVDRAIPDVGQGTPDKLLADGGRVIKTHEPYHRVYRRAIYLVRDVRDVAVSEFFYQKKVGAFDGSLEAFIPQFLRGRVNGYGSWQDHVRSWLDSPLAESGLLFVTRYEDLRAETTSQLARMGVFLGIDWDHGRISQAVENNSVGRMRAKEESADEGEIRGCRDVPFVRKATAGGWSESLSSEQVRAIEEAHGTLLTRLGYQPAMPVPEAQLARPYSG